MVIYGIACWRLDAYVRKCMGSLGRFIGKHPSHFITVPFLLGLLFASGLQQIVYQSDPKYLFFPSYSRTINDKEIVEKLFPTNYSNYEIGKELSNEYEAHLIFVPKNGSSLLNIEYWKSIAELDKIIYEKLRIVQDKNVTFKDICVKFEGQCVRNTFLSLRRFMKEINSGLLELTYPMTQDPTTYEIYKLPIFAGGITVDENNTNIVRKIQALRLSYILDPSQSKYANLWLSALLEFLDNISTPHLNVYKMTTKSIEVEFASNVDSAIDFLPLSVALLISYNIWNALNWNNPILGKPYVSLVGSLNIVVAIGAAWGFLMYIGVEWISINLASVFILLGVGLDDIYVILFSWRRTSELLSVPERLSLCYEEAAVSITITSLTNIVSFVMGSAFPVFPSVWIFCLYSGIGIFFIYIWTLTFFGGVLAISGYTEETERLKKKQDIDIVDSEIGFDFLNHFYESTLPNILNKVYAKVIVIALYLTYLTSFILIILNNTKEGLDRSKLSRYDSFLSSYYKAEDNYFRQNPYRFQVVFTEALDYSNSSVRQQISNFINKIQNSKYVSQNEQFKENWLQVFDQIVEKKQTIFTGWTLENSEHRFITKLSETLHRHHLPEIEENIVFNHNKTKILASRIFLQSEKVRNSHEEKLMMQDLYEILDSAPFETIIFNPLFPFFDQFLQVLPSTIYSVSITAIVVILITFILIPNIVFTLWVTIALVSIEIGVLGFMVIFEINLDIISMICLIMCVGFSIDYSAHVSYHFVSMNIRNNSIRLKSTLAAYGPPIVQSAVSTMLGVTGLFFLPSYIIRSFSLLLVIVILLGVIHGTVLLPVLLSLTFCNSNTDDIQSIQSSPQLENQKNLSSAIPLIIPSNLVDPCLENEIPKLNKKRRRRSDSFQRSGKARASVIPQELIHKSNMEIEFQHNKDLGVSNILLVPNEAEVSSDEDISIEENIYLKSDPVQSLDFNDDEPEMII
ncbi:patched domain-containing protein 3 [Lepeophtheirus salmonis]|uniref:patched domain-containing protein 3 n=1 Tax=Lepeophtheirus salmonis TaxID=72036 RepID=UPI003AF37B1A